MGQAVKVIKVNGGEAFIEIGESYIRIGVGANTSFVLDKSSMTADADQFNMQMSPKDLVFVCSVGTTLLFSFHWYWL